MSAVRSLSLVLLFSISAFPQAQMASGDINGTVFDPTGAVLPSVAVTIYRPDTGLVRETVTGAYGDYAFPLLPPGDYEVEFALPGFATTVRRPIRLLVGQSLSIDESLRPAALQQEVLVVGEAPIVETRRTQQADTVNELRIDNLPINRRDFLDFSLLTSGVTRSDALVTFSLPLAPTSGLSFAGQNGRSNSVTIDGLDNNDNGVGAVRSTLSQDAVQEFQINRANYSAEFGRASGGLINIVSKSGTNAFHGSAFAFVRNQALDARNAFAFGAGGSSIDPPFKRVQSGFTAGGPIERDRTFFFLSYEGLYQRESNFSTFLENEDFFQPTAAQRALIDALGASRLPDLRFLGAALGASLTTSEAMFPGTVALLRNNSGVFPFRNNDNIVSFRVDRQVSDRNQMFARVSFADSDTVGGAFGGLKGPSRGANFQAQDFSFSFGDSHFFSPNVVNEFRFQFADSDLNSFPADALGPEININGIAMVGRDFFLPAARNEKRLQFVENFTVIEGPHALKFGGEFQHLPQKGSVEVFLGGRFIFGEAIPLGAVIDSVGGPGTTAATAAALGASGQGAVVPALSEPITSLQSYNLGLPLLYQQGFGDPVTSLTNRVLAGYVQDNFRLTPGLTLTLGLRYDLELQPPPVHRDTNNIAPRVGFAWSPDGRWVVRGGYGVFYAPVYQAIAFIERVLDGSRISQIAVPITGVPQLGITATSAQIWGSLNRQGVIGNRVIGAADIAPLGLIPGTTPPVLLRSSPELVNPYSQHGSFGIERELAAHWSAGVDYLMNRGVKLLRSRNVNLQAVGSNAFGPVLGPIDPRILQDNVVESSGSSIYHGMTATLRKRFNDFHQFQVSYTFSKAIDDTVDFITDLQAANSLDLAAERSLSSFDQRNRLVVSGVFATPFERGFGIGRVLADMTLAPIVTLSSGRPFNLLLGFDANGDTNANTDRPAFAGRNTGKGPGFASVDFRVAKAFEFGDGYRIEAIAEGFNVLNTVNYSGVNNVIGTEALPSHHIPGDRSRGPAEPLGFTSAFAPRQIQLGVKFEF